jgi:hypothetical protein
MRAAIADGMRAWQSQTAGASASVRNIRGWAERQRQSSLSTAASAEQPQHRNDGRSACVGSNLQSSPSTDRSVEEHSVLGHARDDRAQRLLRHVTYVMATHKDRTGVDFEQPAEQTCAGRLATAAWAHLRRQRTHKHTGGKTVRVGIVTASRQRLGGMSVWRWWVLGSLGLALRRTSATDPPGGTRRERAETPAPPTA